MRKRVLSRREAATLEHMGAHIQELANQRAEVLSMHVPPNFSQEETRASELRGEQFWAKREAAKRARAADQTVAAELRGIGPVRLEETARPSALKSAKPRVCPACTSCHLRHKERTPSGWRAAHSLKP